MSKRRSNKKSYFRLATILLISGVGLILISFVISILFIQGTNFKDEYRARQYQQCLERGNSQAKCQQSFRE